MGRKRPAERRCGQTAPYPHSPHGAGSVPGAGLSEESLTQDKAQMRMPWRRHPPPRAQALDYYLTPGGTLDVAPPTANHEFEYSSDPNDPVPAVWGAILSLDYGQQGPGDLRSIEARADVLTFTTPTLTAPLSLEGAPSARLWIDCTAVDTDLAVRMSVS